MVNVLYGELPKLTDKIRERRLKLAGHCHRHPELVAHKLTLWDPQQGSRSRGGRKHTYIDTLIRDAGDSFQTDRQKNAKFCMLQSKILVVIHNEKCLKLHGQKKLMQNSFSEKSYERSSRQLHTSLFLGINNISVARHLL